MKNQSFHGNEDQTCVQLPLSRLTMSTSTSWLVVNISSDVFVIDWMVAEIIDNWDEILPTANIKQVVDK